VDPKLAIHLLTYALMLAMVVAAYFAYLNTKCFCGDCQTHALERREKAEKRRLATRTRRLGISSTEPTKKDGKPPRGGWVV
jgi:hypothetical protein